jgi:hypothetical protein
MKRRCGGTRRRAAVTEIPEFTSLPGYIRRYLSTRYGSIGEDQGWSDAKAQRYLIQGLIEDRQKHGLKYLAMTMTDISLAADSTADLINRLAALPTDGTGPVLASELIRRVTLMDASSQAQLVQALNKVAAGIQQQGSARIVGDRILMRMLYRLDFPEAFSVAATCAVSRRTTRREASYRFYLTHGIDDAGREIMLKETQITSIRYRKIIAKDRELTRALGLGRVLELATSTYWRMLAIRGVLSIDDVTDVARTCIDYPLELIWALNEERTEASLSCVLELLEKYKKDAYLLNRILQFLARFRDHASLSRGMRYGNDLLSREATD